MKRGWLTVPAVLLAGLVAAHATEIRNFVVSGGAPSAGSLTPGEIALNRADGKLFWRNPDNTLGSGSVVRGPGFTTTTGRLFVQTGQQYTGFAVSNGTNETVSMIGVSPENDVGLLKVSYFGDPRVQLYAGGPSYIDSGLGIGTRTPGALLDVAGTMRGQVLTLSGAPTASTLPASYWTMVKRTDDGSVKLCANDGGAVKCSAPLQ